jgi:hypothetical protein
MKKILLIAAAAVLYGAPVRADTQAQDYARERALSQPHGHAAPLTLRSPARRQAAPSTLRSRPHRIAPAPAHNFFGDYQDRLIEHH